MKYDYILWDWNGTLYNDLEACLRAVNRSMKKHNVVGTLDKERYFDIFCFPVRDYYEKLGFDFEKTSYEDLAVEFIELYKEECTSCGLQNEVKEMLEFLAAKGIKQTILSASEKQILIERLEFFGIKKYFEEIYALDDVYARSKIELGLKWRSQHKNERILLIGDTKHDFEVAERMGIDCILYTEGHAKKDKLLKVCPSVVDKLSEIKELV